MIFTSFLCLSIVLFTEIRAEPPEKVIGGRDVNDIRQYPFIVAILKNGHHACGGSIIGPYLILTAAHCIVGQTSPSHAGYGYMKIAAGDHRFRQGRQFLDVDRIYAHEGFSRGQFSPLNDIGIIKVAQRIQFNVFIQPIALANTNPLPQTEATVIGWGLVDSYRKISPAVLQQLNVFIMHPDVCGRTVLLPDHKSIICASKGAGHSSCFGDSGGPLVARQQLIGVVSAVHPPCEYGKPAFYTNVYYHRNWILNAARRLSTV